MTAFTKHLVLSLTTSTDGSEILTDRSNLSPIKWFTITVDKDAYVGINVDADASQLKLLAGESYTTPEKVRIFKVTILRATSNNVTVRGSAWY